MVYSSKVFYLGTTEKEFNGKKYKVIGFIDEDTMKTYTCGYESNLETDVSLLPPKSNVNFRFKLDKYINNSRELISLKIVEVLDYDEV